MLGSAVGSHAELTSLYTTRLEYFLTQAIDTTVRGILYEARGTTVPAELLLGGERTVLSLTERSAIPAAVLTADLADAEGSDSEGWLAQARHGVEGLLTRA